MLAVHRGRTALVAVLGVAILAGTGEALGRGDDRSWEVGAYAFNSSFDNTSNLDDALGFGVRAAYYIRALHALELQVDQATADHVSLPGVEIDVLKYSLNYLRNFHLKRTEKMAPFMVLGWGLLDADDGTGSDDSMVIRIGGGSRSFVTPHFAIRFEGTVFHWNGDGNAVPRKSFYSFDLVIGASWVFGGGAKGSEGPPPPPPPEEKPAPAPGPEPAPEPGATPLPAPTPPGS